MIEGKFKTTFGALVTLLMAGALSFVHSQTYTVQGPATTKVDQRTIAPQVVTVVHRVSGIKVLRMLLHSGAVSAVDSLDETFTTTREVHTNIIAGLVLDGGDLVAVWLPDAEFETESWGPLAPASVAFSRSQSATQTVGSGSIEVSSNVSMTPELMIIGRDGRQRSARYFGFDGITGLSLLKISNVGAPFVTPKPEVRIALGQRARLFSPEPGPESRATTPSKISVRFGETLGTIASLKRGLDGEINRVRIHAPKISHANVGGVAVDDAGQTIGIITRIEGNEAVVLPPSSIRSAAKRVLARKGNVPRLWLGVSGEALALAPVEGVLGLGWEVSQLRSLLKNQSGILLTSITPGSPAELAALRAGDVITRVNNSEVKSTDDFSLFLEDAGKNPLLFTIVRPKDPLPQTVSVSPEELPEDRAPIAAFTPPGPNGPRMSALLKQGIETLPLGPVAAERLNALAGMVVIFVQPGSPASRSGLQVSDVIEGVNGQPILTITPEQLEAITRTNYSLNITRYKQKLVLNITIPTP